MAILVECPACEEQFTVKPEQVGNEVGCDICGKSFTPSSGVVLRVKKDDSESSSLATSVSESLNPLTSRVRKTNSNQTSSSSSESSTAPTPPAAPPSELKVDSDSLSVSPELSPIADESLSGGNDFAGLQQSLGGQQEPISRVTNRSKSGPLIMGLMGLIGVVAVLGVLYVAIDQLSKPKRTVEVDDSTPLLADAANQTNPTSNSANQNGNTNSGGDKSSRSGQPEQPLDNSKNEPKKQKDLPNQVTAPGPDELPITFTMSQFASVWKKNYSYMVKLEVKTPRETRIASGLIIDSRGWVATSISAIRNAESINVTLAARDMQNGVAFKTENDQALGIIALDEKHDLAILAINRDLVMNLTDVTFGSDSRVVGSQRLILGRTPPKDKRLWLKETRIDRRANVNSLSTTTKNEIERLQLDQDLRLLWIIHSESPTDEILGAPMFDKAGKVVAINVGLSSGSANEGFAVPIKYLTELQASATNDPFSFNSLASTDSDEDASGDRPTNVDINSNHPELEALLASCETCADFQFVARADDEAESLALFCDRLGEALKITDNVNLLIEEREDVQDQIDTILKITESSFGSFAIQETARIRKMNQMMTTADLSQKSPLVLIGNIANNPALDEKWKNKSAVIFEIPGTDEFFFAEVDDETPAFRKGERWLVAGYVDPAKIWKNNKTTGTDIRGIEFLSAWESN